jgi:hypothetical protein
MEFIGVALVCGILLFALGALFGVLFFSRLPQNEPGAALVAV